VVQVLFERVLDDKLVGHTDNYIQVAVPAGPDAEGLIGSIVDVRIVSAADGQLAGILP
jgi:tRNA A37 methylthiotransferase MiaB